MKRLLLIAVLLLSAAGLHASSKVEGRIHLKDGTVREYRDGDRIRLPRKRGKLVAWRDAYARDRVKERYDPAGIDSVVCRHPQDRYGREHAFAPTERGWCWVYIETPFLKVLIYSKKGYDIAANGGIGAKQRVRTFSRSKVAYYLLKAGEEELIPLGGASRNTTESFRRRLAGCVADDPQLAEAILRSSTSRSKTVAMLCDYRPAGAGAPAERTAGNGQHGEGAEDSGDGLSDDGTTDSGDGLHGDGAADSGDGLHGDGDGLSGNGAADNTEKNE